MTYDEAKQLVHGFENGTYPEEKWSHEAHFVMALWYTYHEPLPVAKRKIKEGIKNYNISVGGKNTQDSGYHETITELYIQVIVQYQLSFTNGYDFENLLNSMYNQDFMDKSFPFKFYSKEYLMSREARAEFLRPDKTPLLVIESSITKCN